MSGTQFSGPDRFVVVKIRRIKYLNIFPVPNEVIRMPKPEKRFQSGGIEASIFENEFQQNGKAMKLKKVAFQKRYKSPQGWKTTYSLDINDIPKAILVLSKTYEFLVLNPDPPTSGGSGNDDTTG